MYLFFDTETTGLPTDYSAPAGAAWPRIVSLSWRLMADKDTLIGDYYYIIKPDGFRIPAEASAVHGISTEYAEEHGYSEAFVLKLFNICAAKCQMVVAHNLHFDLHVLETAYMHNTLPYHLWNKQTYCTMEAGTEVTKIPNRYGYKWPKLIELYRHYFKEDFEGQHNSLADTVACSKCFWELYKPYKI